MRQCIRRILRSTDVSFVYLFQAPTYMVSVENSGLRGGGQKFKNEIWDAVRPTIEAWTGMKLKPTSLYGIRVRPAQSYIFFSNFISVLIVLSFL